MTCKKMIALFSLIAVILSLSSCASYSSGSTVEGVYYIRNDNRRGYSADCHYCTDVCTCECHTAGTLCNNCSEECSTPDDYADVRVDLVIDRYKKWPVSVASGAFENCPHIRSLVIGESVPTVGANAFSNCPNLIEVIVKGVDTVIDESAFAYCSKLDKIVFESSSKH
jgi:hypothetical protein